MNEPIKLEDHNPEDFLKLVSESIDNKDVENLVIIGIKTRGEYLAKRIANKIKEISGSSVLTGTIDIGLYRDDFKNKKLWPDLKKSEIPPDIEGKNIILVDDVLFTGRTVRAAINAIMDYGRPSSIKLAVLIDRGNRELPIQADYIGKTIKTKPDQQVNVYLKEVDKREEVEIVGTNGF